MLLSRSCKRVPQMFWAWILFSCLIEVVVATETHNTSTSSIVVAKWEFYEYSTHFTVMLFLLVMILIKMAYRAIPHFSEFIPESLLLIVMGIIFGAIVRFAFQLNSLEGTVWQLTPTLFFTYLLPPIALESSYSLYNRKFSEYLGVVLIFAVLGTIFNFLIIGFAMYGLQKAGAMGDAEQYFELRTYLLFSSLIVAVDPVAVLAIFQDIGVELGLYYVMFGESLLNDAITIVLYNIMSAFIDQKSVSWEEIGLGIVSFFTVSFGGLLIGLLIGIISCLLTRISNHLSVINLLLLAYFSYLMANCVGWSGIISIIGCGLLQAAYAFHNLDHKSITLVHKLSKVVSEVSESVVFLFIGIEVVSDTLRWHTEFILWSMAVCLVARTVVILGITAVINAVHIGEESLSITNQIILIYGGLRGAVAFCLAVLIKDSTLGSQGEASRRILITSTLFIILVTVGIMGTTMKPLVKVLKIRMQKARQLSLFSVLNDTILDETLVAIETIAHLRGRNALREMFTRLNEKYLRRFLQREPERQDDKIIHVYKKIAMHLHFATVDPEHMDDYMKDVPVGLRRKFLAMSSVDWSTGEKPSWSESFHRRRRKYTRESTDGLQKGASTEMPGVCASALAKCMCSSRKVGLLPHERRLTEFEESLRNMLQFRGKLLTDRYKLKSHGGSRDSSDSQICIL
ncbi:unnamed protein product [Dicrocoelium dendriticum]|nr:unnamed protein product [Dicrocoelium dendriticum]